MHIKILICFKYNKKHVLMLKTGGKNFSLQIFENACDVSVESEFTITDLVSRFSP